MTRAQATKLVYETSDAAVEIILQSNEAATIFKGRLAKLERKIGLLTRGFSNSASPPHDARAGFYITKLGFSNSTSCPIFGVIYNFSEL